MQAAGKLDDGGVSNHPFELTTDADLLVLVQDIIAKGKRGNGTIQVREVQGAATFEMVQQATVKKN